MLFNLIIIIITWTIDSLPNSKTAIHHKRTLVIFSTSRAIGSFNAPVTRINLQQQNGPAAAAAATYRSSIHIFTL
jgi:hypothetical protein